MATGSAGRPDQGTLRIEATDGSPLSVWVEGKGPPIVLVHGSLGDHSGFTALVSELRGDFTTFALDRRGFGATPDTHPYSMEREFSDVAAVVDAVAGDAGVPVSLIGHSFGANCAMGAAARTANVRRLVLYEPSLGLHSPPESIARIEESLAKGDREAAVVMVLMEQLEMTRDEVEALRATPRWDVLLAGAPTMPRETRVESEWMYAPGQFEAIAAPTLMLAGAESPLPMLAATIAAAAALPDATIRVLAGHGHLAHRTDPGLVASMVRGFVGAS
jgi:pimeloyl-ACP methyl ester carboxylesterase